MGTLTFGGSIEGTTAGKKFDHHNALDRTVGAWELPMSKLRIGDTHVMADSFVVFDPMALWLVPNATDWQSYKLEFTKASTDFVCKSFLGTEMCASTVSDCSKYYDALPTITYVVDYTEFVVPPQAYTYSQPNMIEPQLFPNKTTFCMIEIYPWANEETVFGEPFFTQYSVQFNYEKSTIGFALNASAAPGSLLK